MKYIRLLLLMILLLPVMVFSKDECDNSKIQIKSIEVSDKSILVEELSPPTVDGLKLRIDVSLSKPGDSITYKLEVENKSNSDYSIKKEDIVSNSEFINYDVSYLDDSNVIKSHSNKEVYLKVSYDTEVPSDKLENGILKENQKVNVALLSEKRKDNILKNPETGTIIFLSFVIIMSVLFLIFSKKQKNIKYVLLLGIMFIPIITKAACAFPVVIDSNVTIDTRSATFKPGEEVNIQMKKLANPELSNITIATDDVKTISIKRSYLKPNNLNEDSIVSISESENPIYMWFDADTLYYYTDAKIIYLNDSANLMFSNFAALIDLSGISVFDASKTTSLRSLFQGCEAIVDLDAIANWDVSNVTNLYGLCRLCYSLEDISGLKDWDISNVNDLTVAFMNCKSLKNVDALSEWNTEKVTTLKFTFLGCKSLINVDGLAKWNISNTNILRDTFHSCVSLENINGLANWDVSNVTDFSGLLVDCGELTSIDPLSKWDVSNANNMDYMFENCNSLMDASGINNWDINNVTSFSYMFTNHTSGVFILNPVHPEFTKRPGTWSNNGTFVPDN